MLSDPSDLVTFAKVNWFMAVLVIVDTVADFEVIGGEFDVRVILVDDSADFVVV